MITDQLHKGPMETNHYPLAEGWVGLGGVILGVPPGQGTVGIVSLWLQSGVSRSDWHDSWDQHN